MIVGLLAAVALLGLLAEQVGLPYPAVLVTGGLVFGLVPGIPSVSLPPGLVLLGFLPPLSFEVAFRAASFDLRSSAAQIGSLAIGLVAATIAVVAVVGHLVAHLPWVAALALGALAAPTDPVSASATIRATGAPERIVAILEGESLLNDGAGLAALQVAVAAAATGGIAPVHGLLKFLAISAGGWAIGLACGWMHVVLRRRLDEPSLEIVLSLLVAYGAYTASTAAGCSGVLAAVAAGLYSGRRAEEIATAGVRLRVEPFWDALSFVLQSILFLLIGLQVRGLVQQLPSGGVGDTATAAVVLIAAALVLRTAWLFAAEPVLAGVARLARRGGARLARAELATLAWSGMRGALSLAGALSIPVVAGGHPFPGRDRVIFLVYCIVVGTLLVPSLTLGPIVRRLGLSEDEESRRLELDVRTRIIHAALARLDELAEAEHADADTLARFRGLLELRLARAQAADPGPADGTRPRGSADVPALRRELLRVERGTLAELRARHEIPARVLQRIQHELDLDEARLLSAADQ